MLLQKSNKTAKFVLTIVLFMTLFNPTIIHKYNGPVYYAILLTLVLLSSTRNSRMVSKPFIKHLMPFLAYFVIYMLSFIVFNGLESGYISNINSIIIPFINIILLLKLYSNYIIQYSLTKEDVLDTIVYCTIAQLCCVFSSFLSPTIRNFFLSFSINNGSETIQNVMLNTINLSRRGYGFAENLFDAFALVLAMLASTIFSNGIDLYLLGNKKQGFIRFALITMLLFACAINARTGVLLILLGMLLVILFRTIRNVRVFGVAALITISMALLYFIAIRVLPENTMRWLNEGVNSIVVFVTNGEKTGALDVILSPNLPNDILFGIGGEPYMFSFERTDSGYARLIWKFGLIGSILLGLCLHNLIRHYLKNADNNDKAVIVVNFMLLLAYTIKLLPFANTGAMFIVFGLPYLLTNLTENEAAG